MVSPPKHSSVSALAVGIAACVLVATVFPPAVLAKESTNLAKTVREATEVPSKIPCGTEVHYWSSSCGPISSAKSRHCSQGGERAHGHSCHTHLHQGSRGCGLAKLGCQSHCVKRAASCDAGEVSFITDQYFASERKPHVALIVTRRFGADGAGRVEVGLCDDVPGAAVEQVLSETVLSWEDGDQTPRGVSVTLGGLSLPGGQVRVCLQAPDKVTLSEYAVATVHVVPDLSGTVALARAEWRAHESEGGVEIEVERTGDLSTAASVDLVHIGGSATPVADFVPFAGSLAWAAGEGGVKTVKIFINDNEQTEPDETIWVGLRSHKGCGRGEFASSLQHGVVVILNDDVNQDEAQQRQGQIESLAYLLDLELDPHLSENFMGSFHVLDVKAGTVVGREGDPSSEFYVLEAGSCDVWTTYRTNDDDADEDGRGGGGGHGYAGGGPFAAVDEEDEERDPELGKRMFTMGPGGTYGLFTALFGAKTRACSLRCTEDSRLWLISRRDMHRYALINPQIKRNLLRNELRKVVARSKDKNPVLLFPGFMSSRLVAWQNKGCRGIGVHVLDHVWLSIEKLMQTMISDKSCWLDCLRLGAKQGDPADCKVRAMDGLEALAELAPGVFTAGPTTIYGNIIAFLANEFGYDINNIIPFPYDWRLSPDMMERRDGFFYETKQRIEAAVKNSGKAAVAVGHSQGNIVFLQLMRYVQHHWPDTADAWIRKHIIAYYGLGAPLLGSMDPIVGTTSGTNMGLPISDAQAKNMAITFGSMSWFLPTNGRLHGNDPKAVPLPMRPDPLWEEEIVSVELASGERHGFGTEELLSGEYYQFMASHFNDTRYLQQYEYLRKSYHNDPLSPLHRAYERPPVRNVFMFYGINKATDYGVQYKQKEGQVEPTILNKIVEDEGGALKIKQSGELVGSSGQGKSGDETVPYVSLSYCQTWHHDPEAINVTESSEKLVEYYDNPIGRWGERKVFSLMNTVEPSYTKYESKQTVNGEVRTTQVYEVDKLGHRNIVKEAFTLDLFRDTFLSMIENEVLNYVERNYGSDVDGDGFVQKSKRKAPKRDEL